MVSLKIHGADRNSIFRFQSKNKEERAMISFGEGRKISTVVISTACGYDGRGIFPYTTHRDYGDMIRTANVTGTTRISKSMTRYERSGNFHLLRPWTWKYIQSLGDDGM